MVAKKKNTDKRRLLFDDLNAKQLQYDLSIGNNIRCPLCWQLFTPDSLLTDLTLEHVPPTATAKLISEKKVITLTCKKCNHTYGRKYQSDLKNFVRHQLFERGEFSGTIPSEVTFPGTKPLKCNVTWTQGKWHIVGVPKANNPATTERHKLTLNELAANQSTDWGFRLEGSFEYRLPLAWLSYLHAAYLLIYIRTDCHYSYSKAGQALRRILTDDCINQFGACVIPPLSLGVGGKPWIAHIIEPNSLRCLWAKVAGNIVIMPLGNDVNLSCYKAWQDVSEQIHFGLSPKATNLKIGFISEEDMLEAQKCIPHFFENATQMPS